MRIHQATELFEITCAITQSFALIIKNNSLLCCGKHRLITGCKFGLPVSKHPSGTLSYLRNWLVSLTHMSFSNWLSVNLICTTDLSDSGFHHSQPNGRLIVTGRGHVQNKTGISSCFCCSASRMWLNKKEKYGYPRNGKSSRPSCCAATQS